MALLDWLLSRFEWKAVGCESEIGVAKQFAGKCCLSLAFDKSFRFKTIRLEQLLMVGVGNAEKIVGDFWRLLKISG